MKMHEMGKALTQAVRSMDEKKLLQLALQNRSKKDKFSFKDVVKCLSTDKIDEMCEQLKLMIIKHCEIMFIHKNDSFKQTKIISESSRILLAVIDIAQVILDENLPISVAFLHMIVYLNGILLDFPAILESLQNRVAQLCEKMFHRNYVNQNQYFTFNTLIYLLKRTLKTKATKADLSRIYALRSLIPKILTMENVNKSDIWELLKKIAASTLYSSTSKGQKIMTMIFALDPDHVTDIHSAIKKKIPLCSKLQAEHYGKVYYDAWIDSIKTNNEALTNELEISCIQDFVTMAILSKPKHTLFVLRKLLAVIHAHKKETYVSKMLYHLFQPVLWMYLKHPDGLYRAHAAALFFDVFPLEDPENKIVTSDQELNEQFLMIQDLLVDEYPVVRITTVKGLCITMSTNWELFPEDTLKTYFKIITNELSYDSSSAEVRTAVAKGARALLENVLTIPTMQIVLPKLKHLFHDISDSARIAFSQVLLKIKKISAIKYFDVVPLEELLARLEEDPVTQKIIVNLIYNSYFPRDANVASLLLRSANIIKHSPAASRVFFLYIPQFHGLQAIVKFICKTMYSIHLFVMKDVKLKECATMKRARKESFDDLEDIYKLGFACGFDDEMVVGGFMEAIVIMWLASLNELKKEENKKLLKQAVGEICKCLKDLLFYYKGSKIFPSVAYLGSHMPYENLPCLGSFCFNLLQNEMDEETTDLEEYSDVIRCLCNQYHERELLSLLKEWIRDAFFQPTFPNKRTKKRKGRSKNEAVTSRHKLGAQMLLFLLNDSLCQRILLLHSMNELSSFLSLFDPLKKRIEVYQLKYIPEVELEFMKNLFHILLKIVSLMNQENFDCKSIVFLDTVVTWMQNTLCSLAWSNNNLPRSSKKQNKASYSFQKLSVSLCKVLCTIIGELVILGFHCLYSCKYLRFVITLIETEDGPSMIAHVSNLLSKYITMGIYAFSVEKDDKVITLVFDCFRKFICCLSDDFVNALSAHGVRELQSNLSNSLMTMYYYGVFKKVDVMICFVKNILSSIKKTVVESQDSIFESCEPFSKIQISKSSAFLLTTMFYKQKILVCFFHHLDKHLSTCEKDSQTWLSSYIIILQTTEIKNVSKNLKKEVYSLCSRLEKNLNELYPLHPEQLVSVTEMLLHDDERPKQSFNIHCHLELKRLKNLLHEKM